VRQDERGVSDEKGECLAPLTSSAPLLFGLRSPSAILISTRMALRSQRFARNATSMLGAINSTPACGGTLGSFRTIIPQSLGRGGLLRQRHIVIFPVHPSPFPPQH
jgi:hypothetical protein